MNLIEPYFDPGTNFMSRYSWINACLQWWNMTFILKLNQIFIHIQTCILNFC